MTLEDARALLDYHYWARDRMLAGLDGLSADQYTRDLGNSFRSVRDTVVHTYGAEWIWYLRWIGSSPPGLPNPEDFPDLASIRDPWTSHEQKMRAFLESLGSEGIERVFDYQLFNGQAGQSVFCHMLQHVVNHATFHRGQVTTMMRQLGAPAPKPQDLIAYYREHSAR